MSATETRHIGAPLKRKEDDPLLRGRGTYVDNIDLPGTVVMAVVRSPYAHARITSIDTAAAEAAEGVVAVFTGADLRDDWKAPMPCAWPVTEDMKSPEHFPLAVDEVHYQGDGVAVVIADTRAHAVDAAELVDVDYEPLDVDRRRRGGGAGRRDARPRGARHERLVRLEARDRRPSTTAPT